MIDNHFDKNSRESSRVAVTSLWMDDVLLTLSVSYYSPTSHTSEYERELPDRFDLLTKFFLGGMVESE